MTSSFGRVVILAAAALLWLPATGLAQSAPANAPAGNAAAGNAPSDKAAEARVEARIKQLHAQLHITPAEETQWNQFAQTMRDNAREIDQAAMERSQQYSSMNAVDNLQSYEKLAEAHVQRLQKLIPAFQALYNAMTPDQKKIADEVFRARVQARSQATGNSGGQASVNRAHMAQARMRPHYYRHHYYEGERYSSAEQLNHQELQRLGAASY